MTLEIDDIFYVLSFEYFPYFKHQKKRELITVSWLGLDGYHWPRLDLDYTIDMFRETGLFPLVAKTDHNVWRWLSTPRQIDVFMQAEFKGKIIVCPGEIDMTTDLLYEELKNE